MYDQLKTFITEYIRLPDINWVEVLPLFKPIEIRRHDFLIREGLTIWVSPKIVEG